MGLLSVSIWLPIAFGAVLLATGREDKPDSARWLALVWLAQAHKLSSKEPKQVRVARLTPKRSLWLA